MKWSRCFVKVLYIHIIFRIKHDSFAFLRKNVCVCWRAVQAQEERTLDSFHEWDSITGQSKNLFNHRESEFPAWYETLGWTFPWTPERESITALWQRDASDRACRSAPRVENCAATLLLDVCENYRNVLQGEDKETQPNIAVHRRTNDTELTLDQLI